MEQLDKTKVCLSIETVEWKQFQEFCKKKLLIPSYEIQKFIEKQNKEFERKEEIWGE